MLIDVDVREEEESEYKGALCGWQLGKSPLSSQLSSFDREVSVRE